MRASSPSVRIAALAGIVAAVSAPQTLIAQCADGTPPPCGDLVAAAPVRADAPGPQARGRSFLVLPFRNVTRSEEHAWLVEGSPVLLSDALGQWEEVSVVPPERLYPALRRAGLEPGDVMAEESVRRVAEETRGWTAVTGDVLVVGQRIQVRARAYDVVDGDLVVEAAEEVGIDDDIRVAYERLAGRLLTTAGIDEETAPNLAEATTASLDAYKAFLRGVRHHNRGEAMQAEQAYQEAIALDSTFAQAYAKLAVASLRSVQAIVDPQSPSYRYAERAAQLASRLPGRDRAIVEAYGDFFRADFVSARDRIRALLDVDPNDVEALELMSGIEMADALFLEQADGTLRRRGSWNETARYAKRALALDPLRHQEYATLLFPYLQTAGLAGGRVAVVRTAGSSLPEAMMLQAQSQEMRIALFRDSIELIPQDQLEAMDPAELRRDRARGARVAKAWVDRWLAAVPDASQPHVAAAMLAETVGDYEDALRHLEIADSIGIESELDPPGGRRMVLHMKIGALQTAETLLDQLVEDAYYDGPTIGTNRFVGEHAAWGVHLYLGNGRFEAADALVRRYSRLLLGQVPDTAFAEAFALCIMLCRGEDRTHTVMYTIPDSVRLRSWRGALESLPAEPGEESIIVARLFTALDWSIEPAHSMLGSRANGAAAPASVKHALVEAAVSTAESDAAVSHSASVDLAAFAVHADSTDAAMIERAFAILDRVRSAAPDSYPGRSAEFQIGKVGAVSGLRMDEALQALTSYIAFVEARDAAEAPTPLIAALRRLAQLHERAERLPEALAVWQRVLEVNPVDAAALAAVERLGG